MCESRYNTRGRNTVRLTLGTPPAVKVSTLMRSVELEGSQPPTQMLAITETGHFPSVSTSKMVGQFPLPQPCPSSPQATESRAHSLIGLE